MQNISLLRNRCESFNRLRSLLCWPVSWVLLGFLGISLPAVAQTATTTTLSITSSGSAVTSVASGTVVTLTATVIAGSTPVTQGLVNFCDATATYCEDFHIVGTAQLTSAGTAVFKFRPAIGSHSYKAVFVGTKTNATSTTAASTLAVTGTYPTNTTLSWTGSPAKPTLSSAVGSANPSQSVAGTVSFIDTSNGNSVLGTAPLVPSSPQASLLASADLPAYDQAYAIADFNGDGIPDIAVYLGSGITVYFGNGDGTFTPSSASTTVPPVGQLVAGDFNSDGIPDLAASVYPPDTTNGVVELAILLGKGDGTFTLMPILSFDQGLVGFSIGDFNNDGIPDVYVEFDNNNVENFGVLFGNGDGTFSSLSSVTQIGGYDPVIADFNGDGFADLAYFNCVSAGTPCYVNIALGNGDGTFTPGAQLAFDGVPSIPGIQVADFNGDGIPDVVANYETGSSSSSEVLGLVLFLGTGNGNFSQGKVLNPSTSLIAPAVGDFNGDGIPDIAAENYVSNQPPGFVYFLGNGDGTFTTVKVQSSINYGLYISAADFNGDGISDLVSWVLPSPPANIFVGLTNVQGSTASIITPALATGTHVIQASYSGDSNFNPSLSPTITIDTPAPPILTSPTPGSQLSGATVTFTWTPGSGVSRYLINAGTRWPGSDDIYGSGVITATSATVSGIPTNGVTVYVLLRYEINGVWTDLYYTYTASGSLTPPALTTPAPGSHLTSPTATFQWSPGSGPSAYLLTVGTKWPGSSDIYGTGVTTATSATVPNLPTNGVNVYVQLRYEFNGVWTALNYTYTADGTTAPPVMISPAPGSQLSGSTVTFNWTPGTGVTAYSLFAGTYGPGYFNIGSSPTLTTTSFTLPNVPTNSKPVYVTLRYQINGVWQTTNYTYTAQ